MKTAYLDDRIISNAPPCRHNFIKLTKKALTEFIGWTTSRYNDYLGFGSKKERVNCVFQSFLDGYFVWVTLRKDNTLMNFRIDKTITTFIIQCASPVGESGTNKRESYWRTKQSGDLYIIDCKNKTIYSYYSKRSIKFI